MPDKTLPDDASDCGLPGRAEDSGAAYPDRDYAYDGYAYDDFDYSYDRGYDDRPPGPRPRSWALVAMAVALVAVLAGSSAYYAVNQAQIDSAIMASTALMTREQKVANEYGVGQVGSDHAHAALAIFVAGEAVDLGLPRFQLQSGYIHLEDHDPHIVHRHATKAPLEMLFTSLGLEVTPKCIGPAGPSGADAGFCATDMGEFAVFVVNGQYREDINPYEIRHNDRILISYGDPRLIPAQIKYLESVEIPDIPKAERLAPARDVSI